MVNPPRRQGIFKSLLSKIGFETKDTGTLAYPPEWLEALLNGGFEPTLSGVVITPQVAMTCAPVRAAVQVVSETIAQIPVAVYQRGEDGSRQSVKGHPVYSLLQMVANDWTAGSTFREEMTRDAFLERHGAFAFINRVDGKPIELIRLDPRHYQIEITHNNSEPVYRVIGGGTDEIIDKANLFHLPTPSRSTLGLYGGLLHDARQAIGLAIVLERHAATLFGRGARPSGILKFPSKLDAATSARMKASWAAAHGGQSSGGTAVLEEGADWQALTLNSVDAQFLELRKFSIEEVSRHFGVNPIFLMDLGRATWSNAEAMANQLIAFSIVPWIRRWQGEIGLKLLTPEERATLSVEFDTDSLLRANFDKRMDGWGKAIAARIINPNEVRAAENLPPYAGGDQFLNPHITPEALPVMPAPGQEE
jgi:HK97 family phage portal protein